MYIHIHGHNGLFNATGGIQNKIDLSTSIQNSIKFASICGLLERVPSSPTKSTNNGL